MLPTESTWVPTLYVSPFLTSSRKQAPRYFSWSVHCLYFRSFGTSPVNHPIGSRFYLEKSLWPHAHTSPCALRRDAVHWGIPTSLCPASSQCYYMAWISALFSSLSIYTQSLKERRQLTQKTCPWLPSLNCSHSSSRKDTGNHIWLQLLVLPFTLLPEQITPPFWDQFLNHQWGELD